MQTYALLALLPTLAFALPATDSASAEHSKITPAPSSSGTFTFDFCETATGAAGISCILTAEGYNEAAASYLASVDSDPAVSSLLEEVFTNTAIAGPLNAAYSSIGAAIGTGSASPSQITAYEGLLQSVAVQHLSEVPSGTARDVFASVFSAVDALQTGGSASASPSKAAAAPRQSVGLGVAAGVAAGVVGLALGL